ncbi:MAG: hypothetical protein PHY93_03325 [Bacteriovorax sp.]|nr:hypothetical protein [Bacteriovorax sp.]
MKKFKKPTTQIKNKILFLSVLTFIFFCEVQAATTLTPLTSTTGYRPMGIGGGGAMSGVSISPYADLWFVGTDMGTLFKSTDLGKSWNPVNHYQATFDSDLSKSVSIGFAADGTTVFHSSAGVNPKRSTDAGNTFSSVAMELVSGELIKYWLSDSSNSNVMFAGTTKGILKSSDNGVSWFRISGITEEATGTFIDQRSPTKRIYHATTEQVLYSDNDGVSFSTYYHPATAIRQFAGGSDENGVTLALGDSDGPNACSWVYPYLNDWGRNLIDQTIANCGFVWVNKDNAGFVKNNQTVGDHLKMAENDSSTIYTTGGRRWIRQYGTKVYVSHDRGGSWSLKLNQINYDVTPYAPWPSSKLEYSAVALDIGWFDSGYESFAINQKNSNMVAGAGYFFLHSSMNGGDNWLAPFTKFNGAGTPTQGQTWKSTGLEVTSVYKTKFHPSNSSLLYAAMADISGSVSEDHGASFRITQTGFNSIYDYAFDPNDDLVVFAASGDTHDFPNYFNVITSKGGLFKSSNRGKSWTRITPVDATYNRQFLSIAYDARNNIIYGGTQEIGIVSSADGGASWKSDNMGLPAGNKIIPQIEIDPNTGNAYALLTGDAPNFTNQAYTGVYFLDVQNKATSWVLLRGVVNYPTDADAGSKVWYYPTSFAINFNSTEGANTIYLADYENHSNWLMTGVWKTTDKGATWNRVKQVTHATEVKIDPKDSNKIYVVGYHQLDGNWGDGGELHSKDGGVTWFKNDKTPLQINARGVTLDPLDASKIIYSYFGGGMLYGPNP